MASRRSWWGGNHRVDRIAGIGAISDDSIEVVTIPSTGRTAIFFWSEYGPYIFDGAVFQYVGFGIEDDGTQDNDEYSWLIADSVVTLHDVKNKELICLYRPVVNSTASARHDKAIVYNYRFQVWYTYTGMLGVKTLTTNFSVDQFAVNMQTGGPVGESASSLGNTSLAYIGAENGKIYKWGDASTDGLPVGFNLQTYPITAYDSPTKTLTINGTLVAKKFTHLWVCIKHARTGEWYNAQIETNAVGTVTLYSEPTEFTPRSGDTLYVCLLPSSIEFPWDNFDLPLVDKNILELITWHNKEFYLRMSKDWDSTDYLDLQDTADEWHTIGTPDVANGRSRTEILKKAEAAKLELVSFEEGATLDAFAYYIDYHEDGVTPQ